jgi:hypothetical protein
MARYRWLLLGALAGVVVLVAWWWMSTRAGTMAIDLVERFPSAARRPTPDVFSVQDIGLGGVRKPSIAVAQASRITWTEQIPAGAWLDVSLGLHEEAWSRPGDGVLFRVGVSRAGVYEELISLVVNPFANAADRQWYPLLLDLSPWAGETIEIIFNTNAGAGSNNTDNDLAVWGAPRVVVR